MDKSSFKPQILAFVCNWCAYGAADLAGVSRLPLSLFLGYSLVGRLLWTSAYFGLGYVAGANFSAASGFLFNLGMSLLFILAGGLAAYILKAGLTATGRTG